MYINFEEDKKTPFFGLTAVLVFLNNRSNKLPWNWMTLRL